MGEILQTPIINEVEQSFLDYSLSVITDRAIPAAEDGLKPVARRILWDMYDNGFLNSRKFVKCAQPVGDTMARLHPHGDSSIYGALAWLSQPWNMRYPLVSFHGNNGSRDGDEPAAYRYTECKLSKCGEEMLHEIKKDEVDWQLTYTDEEKEPVYLPGRIPNLLVNGTSGIAVALSCSWAPHNLNEILNAAIFLLDNPDCKIEDIMNFIQGPDFPTGGIVINKNELFTAYSSGKGRARIRGEYAVETNQGQDSIVFTSIPYKVSKEQLITDIDKLCENGTINGISTIRDESNKDGVRFVIELEKGVSTPSIIAKLFKNTRLEDTYSFNQVALVNKKPKLLNIKQAINIYNEHQKDVLIRKTNYEIKILQHRIHILEGLLIALEDIDNVITLIKTSESSSAAKISLITKYKLSEEQAQAILDLKLSKLAKLEKFAIETEKKEKEIELQNKQLILLNPIPTLKEIFEELKRNYGDERRTTITYVEPPKAEDKEIIEVTPEKCVVVLSESGLIKRIPIASFRTQHRNGTGIKSQDDITSMTIRTNTIDSLMVFTNKGQMYRLLVDKIPIGTNVSKGVSVKSLIDMEVDEIPQVIYSIYRDTDAKYVLFTTKNGLVKKTSLEEYLKTKKKNGIAAINLRENDEIASVNLIKDEEIIVITKKGNVIRFSSNEIGATGRASFGVKGINLNEDDSVITTLIIRDNSDSLALFAINGNAKRIPLKNVTIQKRGGKGQRFYKDPLAAAALLADSDNILISGNRSSICISASEIPIVMTASTIGNIVIKNNQIVSITKI